MSKELEKAIEEVKNIEKSYNFASGEFQDYVPKELEVLIKSKEALQQVIKAAESYDNIYKDLFEAADFLFMLSDEIGKCRDTLNLLSAKLGRLILTHPNDIPKPPPNTALAPKRFDEGVQCLTCQYFHKGEQVDHSHCNHRFGPRGQMIQSGGRPSCILYKEEAKEGGNE